MTDRVNNNHDNDHYKQDFVREQIKEKPVSRKKLVRILLISALCGCVFALAAGLFFWLGTTVYQRGQAEETPASEQANEDLREYDTEDTESATEMVQIPYVGLDLCTVTDQIAENNQVPKGVYIREVEMDSPAMDAGLQSGDVITAVDGETILLADVYNRLVLAHEPGDKMRVTVLRMDGDSYREVNCTVTISVNNN